MTTVRNAGMAPGLGAVLAALASAGLLLWDVRGGRFRPLVSVGFALFSGLALLHLLIGRWALHGYDRSLAVAVLALALGALSWADLDRFPEFRHRVGTRRTGSSELASRRRLALWCSYCAGASAASMALGAHYARSATWTTVCNWLVPLAFALVAATAAEGYRAHRDHGRPDASAAVLRDLLVPTSVLSAHSPEKSRRDLHA